MRGVSRGFGSRARMAIAIVAEIGARGWIVGPEALHAVRDGAVIDGRLIAVPIVTGAVAVAVVAVTVVVGRS